MVPQKIVAGGIVTGLGAGHGVDTVVAGILGDWGADARLLICECTRVQVRVRTSVCPRMALKVLAFAESTCPSCSLHSYVSYYYKRITSETMSAKGTSRKDACGNLFGRTSADNASVVGFRGCTSARAP